MLKISNKCYYLSQTVICIHLYILHIIFDGTLFLYKYKNWYCCTLLKRGITDFNVNVGKLFIPFLEVFATTKIYVFVYVRKHIKQYD